MTPAVGGVVLDLFMPAEPCAPCQDALEEVDRAVALVSPELSARGERLRVRVTQHTGTGPGEERGSMSMFEVRVNNVPVSAHETAGCADAAWTACGTYEWDGSTCSVPPAEMLTAAIHDELDLEGARAPVSHK